MNDAGDGDPISGHVLDASALLAYVRNEPGNAVVSAVLERSYMSSVNWSEVVQKTLARGASVDGMLEEVSDLGLRILAFTPEDAETAARLWLDALHSSLGDRACLALALRLGLPVLTADRIWRDLDVGVTVQLIR